MFQLPGGSTDCTLPITWATENEKAVDVFIILTNNPLWAFAASPLEALKNHRQVHTFIHVCLRMGFNWIMTLSDKDFFGKYTHK